MPDGPIDPAFLGVERSLTGRRWRARAAPDRLAEALAQRLDLPEAVGRVLAGRGVGLDDVERFLNPSLRDSLPDPSVLKDMDPAADRLARAIMDGEQVAVFGDYDVDGATSSAVLARFFAAVGGRLRVYIPDRMVEGYGPNTPALLKLHQEGASVVITVDCGTLAFEPLAAVAEVGLEVIVVDHHKAEPALPRASAVINPNRLDDTSDLGQLAAVGVAFLLVVALNRALRRAGWYDAGHDEPDLVRLLDLVALGTVCDVVPLTGLNRALVAQGLKVMARRANVGLAALADVGRVDSTPGTYHAGFILGPRVNAGGRVGEAGLGARLLATDDWQEARAIAEQLDGLNAERQAIERAVLDEATAMAARRMDSGAAPPVVFVAGQGWHPGVIGIVASRLKDRFGRPALVLSVEKGEATGSARSIAGVDIGSAVIEAAHRGLLVKGGGHAMAAGLTAKADRLADLEAFLGDRLGAAVETARSGRALDLDGTVSIGGATPELVTALEAAGPFGVGNPGPRFAVARVRVVKVDRVGANHVRVIVAGGDGGRMKAIAFRVADDPLGQALLGGRGRAFHIAGRLKLDDWGDVPRVEMLLDDAAPADGHPASADY